MAPERKSKKRKSKKKRPSLPPPPTLRQELLMMARGAARTVQHAFLTLVVLGLIAGAAFGAWSLRPIPTYSAAELTVGSPFDVAFRAENKNPWFSMVKLRITCVVAEVRASAMPPAAVEATDVRFPAGTVGLAPGLAPGEAATFRCPFRSLIGHPINDDPAVAQRAEIYFHSEYDLDLFRSVRISDNGTHFVLDMRFLPPRWVAKP